MASERTAAASRSAFAIDDAITLIKAKLSQREHFDKRLGTSDFQG